MSKELEALGLIKRTCELYKERTSYLIGSDIIGKQINEALDTIEQALLELQSIKESNPSEALKCLERVELTLKVYRFLDEGSFLIDNLNTIKKALQRLEAIDNAKPSVALECFSKLIDRYIPHYVAYDNIGWVADTVKTIEQALIKAQEQEKVFDDKLLFKDGSITCGFDYKGKQIVAMPSVEYSRLMEQEKVLEIIREKGYEDYLLEEFDTFEAYKKNFDKFYADQLVIDWNDKEQLIELRIYTEEEFDLMKRYHENEQK